MGDVEGDLPLQSGASPVGDRATRASTEPASGLGHSAGIPSARPSRRDPALRQKAIQALAEECAEWAEEGTAEDWIEPLGRCSLAWANGYEIARDLERYACVAPDASLVEILDGASHHFWSAESEAVKAWVAENNIRPSLSIGDRIRTKRDGEGRINGFDEERAYYHLVLDGEEEKYRRGGGICVNYEDAIPLASAMSASGQDPQGLEAKPASAVAEGQTPKDTPHDQ